MSESFILRRRGPVARPLSTALTAVMVGGLAVAAGATDAAAAGDTTGAPNATGVIAEPVAPYFDQTITLDVDPTMVAAFRDPALGSVTDTLLDAGIAADRTQASGAPGWAYVVLPEGLQTVDDAAAEVRRLGALADLDLVSPVYLGSGGLPVIPTRDMLLQFSPETTSADRDAVLAAHDLTALDRDFAGTPGLVRARSTVTTGADALALALALNARPETVFAQSDSIYWAERSYVPNDPLFGQQWALDQPNDEDMDAAAAWDITTGSPQVTVVVLDSGIQQNHPDLHQLPGMDFTGGNNGGGPNNQCDNHGTAVAGCVAATIDNGTGVVGIAPDAMVRSGKIFNETFFIFLCLPFLESQDSWTVAGINWAADSGARITNSSWGGGSASAAISSAFAATRTAGVLHFAASGNDGTSTIGFPANLATVTAVGAVNSSGARASFSTYGTGLFVTAPGAAVLTTDRTGGDGYESGPTATVDGTSFASPYAAGVAALVLSADPSLTPDEVEDVLAESAVDKGVAGYDTQYGWGFVNARAALDIVGGTACTADVNDTGEVDFADVVTLLAAWGPCPGCPADIDGNDAVDFADLVAVLAAWGPCE